MEASEIEACLRLQLSASIQCSSDDIGSDRHWVSQHEAQGLHGHAIMDDGCQDATKWNTDSVN